MSDAPAAPAVQLPEEVMAGKGVNVMPKKGGGYTLATALPLGGRRRRTKGARRGSRRAGGLETQVAARRRSTKGARRGSRRAGGLETQVAARRRH